ncbi:amidohydrolase family protein [Acetobacterium bakii]|uniref:Enamidase n=1 Tax=Acetobacterium bakii TaxID=52689 RepID=A0A0L6U512_9FIRM|nr:amidohydrolase family protein [Acetobacterium bakii]KNZ43621.1 Enamidase [Acetobacterium bakii]
MSKIVIKNIGKIVTGDINKPVFQADTIVVEDNLITAIGGSELLADLEAATIIDANGTTVTPGLFDTHVHVSGGEFAPRQKTMDFISSALHGGVTTMISAGEAHFPGRPKDPAGAKALAIAISKSYYNAPPSGVKVHGGAVILEKGLTEEDFIEMKAQGVWLVGEVGLGSIKKPEDAAPMVEWAHKYGFKVQMHTGGTSIPGSSTVTADDVIKTKPDVVSHINGGPTAISAAEADRIMDETDFAMEIVQCGNPKIANYVAKRAQKKGQLDRLIFGNDAPSGTGLIALGILRNMCQISSLAEIAPEIVVCMATGNSAKVYELNTGMVAVGKEADLVIMDAPMGSVADDAMGAIAAGDIPGISMVLINGKIVVNVSRNTPPAKRPAKNI